IRIGDPVNAPKARIAIRETDGTATHVTDDELMHEQAQLAQLEGIGVEPASATSVAGVRKLLNDGEIDEDETVVCVATGHLLKDPDAALEISNSPVEADATENSVKEVLEGEL
ncbi:MAG: pyridoxal-phosphate dependent enzyme, partial [Halobacteria archaeon]|nr:pyridoxal-phosphate dependent enzyme [Halobacteria archaeon]